MIMFASSKKAPPPLAGCKRCERFKDIIDGLQKVVDTLKDADAPAGEGDDDAADDPDDDGADTGDEAAPDPRITQLTAILMDIDTDVKTLYNNVFGEMDDNVEREKLYKELIELKVM